MKRKNEGITLITLVITIIVLLILSSIATYSGINVIKSSEFTTFTTELKIMQTQINGIYQKYKNNESIEINGTIYYGEADKSDTTKNTILSIGESITEGSIAGQANKVFTESASEITSQEGYRYWTKDLLKSLGIEGVEQDFFINIEKRSVISYKGLEYEGKTYYTLDQIPNGLYNVEYENPNTGKPSFSVTETKQGDNKWRIDIFDIVYEYGYIDKWQVKYKITGEDYWNTTEDLSFILREPGKYSIMIANGKIESELQTITLNDGANAPNVTNIANKTYVTWTENNGTYEINDTQTLEPSDWYDYENGQWANIKTTANGLTAYWVWIPRFEYIVPTLPTATQIDVKFISKSKTTPDDGYTIHPAFTFNNKQLDGIWVAKFEATSNAPNTIADGGGDSTSYQVQVLPNASSWRSITTNNIFTVCRNMQGTNGVLAGSTNIDSHMMKNMEWGAVAILSQSKYGVFNPSSKTRKTENGGDGTLQVWNNPYHQCENYAFDNTKTDDLDTTISVSNNNIIKTGCAATETAGQDASITTACDSYNTGNGPKASTTGTVYGVYDMAGGSWEYVAGCTNGYENEMFGVTTGDDTYVDLYTNATNSNKDYSGAKTGDATKETKGWNSDYASFPFYTEVFLRGGSFINGAVAGVFCFGDVIGWADIYYSFRPVLVAF